MSDLPDFDALWDYNDPAATEAKFRELLPTAEKSENKDYFLQLMTQIARTLALQRKFDAAHKTLDLVELRMASAGPLVKVRYLLERGRVLNSSGKSDEALPFFEQAWDMGDTHNLDFYAVDAAHMVAIAERDPDVQLIWNLRALELALKTDDERAKKWPGSLHNNIGWSYHDTGEYELALEQFEEALEWRKKEGNVQLIRIAEWCIARAMRSLGQVEEALKRQQQQLTQYEADGEKPGYTYEEIGECLYELDRKDEAKPFFKQAYDALSQDPWLQANETSRLDRLKRLGE